MGIGHIMTLANSIIGVSVLAMPFCFKQCGIILSILVLLLSSIMTRLACHFLLKAAAAARRRNYEFLAFHAFGPKGKLMVELCIIGFLFGTCIAFFVVMGDLGPAIISEVLGINKSPSIRSSVLIGLALLVVLPLGLLRNVDSLSSLCTATILFYFFLVLKIVGEATTHLLAGDWLQYVNLWRPAGILQCIPIFAMALSCQTQVFEIYETLPDPSPSKMNEVVRAAVNICTGVYVCMGFFGYVAVCRPPSSPVISDVGLDPSPTLTGNILMSFPSSFTMQAIKLFFVASVACSFPLVIFPCRASLHSLLFRRAPHHETGMGVSGGGGGSVAASTASLLPPGGGGGQVIERIPERRFRLLTISLVAGSLAVAFALPDIELVLGLVGSSIGTITCLLLPALCFLKVAPSHPYRHTHWGGDKGVTAERLLAQVMIVVGAVILILSTYANLHAVDQARAEEPITPHPLHIPKIPAVLPPGQLAVGETNVIIPVVLPKAVQGIEVPKIVGHLDSPADTVKKLAVNDKKDGEIVKVVPAESVPKELKPEKRQEPPIPEAPDHSVKKKNPSGAEEAPLKAMKNEVEAPKEAPAVPLVGGVGKEVGAAGGKDAAPAAPLPGVAKEAAEVPDSVHGDAIKKEEEEVGIEEGAAKGEEERRKREEEAEEQRKRAEKERREKELLQKLADDRKKQQEQINIQMEILKKLQALEVKKPEPEKKTDAESKVKENVVGADEPKKVDGSNQALVVSAEVKKGDKGEKSGVKEQRAADKGPGIGGEGAPWKSNGIPGPSILKAKEPKKTDQAKIQALDVSQSGRKKDPLAEKTSAKESGGRAALASNMDPLPVKEERKVVGANFSGISQMKAAVPMPLLLVGQPNGILGRNELKAKEREKREVSLEAVEKAVSQDGAIGSVVKECEGGCSEDVKESSKVSDTVVVERDKGYSNSQGEWASSLNVGDASTKDLHRTQDGKQGSDVGNEKVSDEESVPTGAGAAAVDKVKELKGGVAICRDEVVSTRSPLLCTLGAKESDNYLSPTIKAPLRLSDPVEGKTAPGNIETKVNVDGVMMEAMPLKRDLKYIQEVFEDSSDKAEG
ncbi:putative sodium-coupled neutral amino acid transporter 10 [Hetaerina americana]|uniref:putative sodium-coupled neutral amino acid transporter 10 n=1 Tax=Hetaerina americana TaxID=62018 RepID=UPI003A7F5E19